MIAEAFIFLTVFGVTFILLWFFVGKKILAIINKELDSREDAEDILNRKLEKLNEERRRLEALKSEIAVTSELTKIEKEYDQLDEQLRLLNIRKKVKSQKKR